MSTPSLSLETILGISTFSSYSIAISKDSHIAYCCGLTVVLYNLASHSTTYLLPKDPQKSHPKPWSCVCFSPNSIYLASAESGNQPLINIWNIKKKTCIAQLCHGHKFGIQSICFSPCGNYLVSMGNHHDGRIVVWEWRENRKRLGTRLIKKASLLSF